MDYSPIVITPRKVGSMVEVSFFDGRNTMMTDLLDEGQWYQLKQELRKASDWPDGKQADKPPEDIAKEWFRNNSTGKWTDRDLEQLGLLVAFAIDHPPKY